MNSILVAGQQKEVKRKGLLPFEGPDHFITTLMELIGVSISEPRITQLRVNLENLLKKILFCSNRTSV